MEFEWDLEKAAANLRKHGVPFDWAWLIFSDPNLMDVPDDVIDYSEERSLAIGFANGKLLTVVYTMRGDVCRIISARKATRREHKDYYFQIGA